MDAITQITLSLASLVIGVALARAALTTVLRGARIATKLGPGRQ